MCTYDPDLNRDRIPRHLVGKQFFFFDIYMNFTESQTKKGGLLVIEPVNLSFLNSFHLYYISKPKIQKLIIFIKLFHQYPQK